MPLPRRYVAATAYAVQVWPVYFSPVSHIRLVFVTQSRDTGCRSCPATAQLGLEFGFSSFNPVITFHIKFVLG